MRHWLGHTPVGSLFFGGSPSKIVRRIRTVVVTAIQCQTRRGITNVGVEILENKPSFADLNTSSAIIFIGFDVGVEAAGFHRGPNAIDRSPSTAMGFSVAAPFLTAARLRIACGQIAGQDDRGFSAFTPAFPSHGFASGKPYDCELSERTTDQVLFWRGVTDFCHVAITTWKYALVNSCKELAARIAVLEGA
jgi:hypothetical protein